MKPSIRRVLAVAALAFTGSLSAQVPQLLNYQGRVAVGTANFDGTGQFKFALVDAGGATTYWSNDGTSAAGSQPTAAVSLTVTKGLYSVLLGDTTRPNMTAIPANVFSNAELYLRVWFNDGPHGFQLLSPDPRIGAVGYAITAGSAQTAQSVPSGVISTTNLAADLKAALDALGLTSPGFVRVGNVGNPEDPNNSNDIPGIGAVAYSYQIAKYEVTLAEYTAFLNAMAATDPKGLYNVNMASDLNIAGITRSGSNGTFTYSVIGSGNRPVTWVSWFDAARYCNWLHHGRPAGNSNLSAMETGAYTLNGATSGVGFTRNPDAAYWIPSENEWYKAAYHQPADAGGDPTDYWLYPTRSNDPPGNAIGASANQANYRTANSFYSVTQSATYSSTQNYLTNVGAYSGSASYYGTFDQGGGVLEWNEAVIGSNRGLRGGSWSNNASQLQSSNAFQGDPGTYEQSNAGFRVARP